MNLKEALAAKNTTIFNRYRFAYNITLPEGTLRVPDYYGPFATNNGSPKPSDWLLGLDKFPLLNGLYTETFVMHFIDRFEGREIGADLPEFERYLRRWMNLNYPYFDRLYRTTLADLPLDEIDVTNESSESSDSNSSSSNDTTKNATRVNTETGSDTTGGTENSRDAQSRFPSTMVGGDSRYLSEATDRAANTSMNSSNERDANETANETTGETSNESESSTSESSSRERGRRRSLASLVEEQRSALMNVDAQILDAMEPLFLGYFNKPCVTLTSVGTSLY